MNNDAKVLSLLEAVLTEQQKMRTEQEKMRTEQEKMLAEQEKTNQRLDNLEEDMRFVRHTVIHIENDHGKKITALFDAHSLNQDALKLYEPRVAQLERTVDRLESDVINLKSAPAH